MRYFGGKAKLAKYLIPIIQSYIKDHIGYLEPCVGGCNIIEGINHTNKYACDKHPQLIAMWKELQNGWIPPTIITKEDYLTIKDAGEDYLKGFVGFGCSFGGKYFGGYAGLNEDRNYALNAKNSVLKKISKLKDVKFFCKDYKELNPNNLLIYIDPPYANTTKYTVDFDSTEFWQWCRTYSKTNTILISEYTAPDDFECIWSKEVKTDMNSNNGKIDRIEKLFKFKNQ